MPQECALVVLQDSCNLTVVPVSCCRLKWQSCWGSAEKLVLVSDWLMQMLLWPWQLPSM